MGLTLDLSHEVKEEFQKFVRGYMTASQSSCGLHTNGSSVSLPLSDSIVEEFRECTENDFHKPNKERDHYDFFDALPTYTDNDEDHHKRLNGKKLLHKRGQVIMKVLDKPEKGPDSDSEFFDSSASSMFRGSGRRGTVKDTQPKALPAWQTPRKSHVGGGERGSIMPGNVIPGAPARGSLLPGLGAQDLAKELMEAQAKPKARSSVGRMSYAQGRRSAAQAAANEKAELRTKEACESLRFLVFGVTGTEAGKRAKDRVNCFAQRCGTHAEVMQLHKVWNQMDEDGSGDIEFSEFLNFFNRSKADRLLGMRCVKYLVGAMEQQQRGEDNDGQATGCKIEDMMRLIWLGAKAADMQQMMQWFREAEFERLRVPLPPLLPKRKRRQILDNFPQLERGPIRFYDFMTSGLVDIDTAREIREQYAMELNDELSEELLLEMLCPNGYRAHANVKTAVDGEGRTLQYISNQDFSGWVVASTVAKWNERIGTPD
eukprot:gnl/TRDRNA2_/TRDRNA2_85013_c0_seq1.p1 gnl/TRDRNA2_/TRDRNA2_85013_c0~~gnl/TRDRNA2_/TRDRNA2_85013_c0_seq1.p1  ORF type:complete len:486 (-),score=101.52 gnl/TRDRNA2_/TRDRNA2_85013_c0_seq1:315-1772(-)